MCVNNLQFFILGISILCFNNVHLVRITSLRVPNTFILDKYAATQLLILDCEYEVNPVERGFVLKWYFEGKVVYQWIPGGQRKPLGMNLFKNRININYTVSDNNLYKYRAMAIINPMWNLTGIYSCAVQTYESLDKKFGKVQIVVPEDDFEMRHFDTAEGSLYIECKVSKIFPQPRISIILGDKYVFNSKLELSKESNGLFNSNVLVEINRTLVDSPTTINCLLHIPGTNYSKKRESIYYYDKIDKKFEKTVKTMSRIDVSDCERLLNNGIRNHLRKGHLVLCILSSLITVRVRVPAIIEFRL